MTIIGIGIALLIGGAIVTETVFAHSRHRPADGRRDPAPRLSDHPGRDPDLLRRLRADQPAVDLTLHAVRSAHPVLTGAMAPSQSIAPLSSRCRRPGGASAMRFGATRPRSSAAWSCCCMIADRVARAVARHGRSAGGVAAQAPQAAVGRVLVRHRHARARRVQPRRLRRARLAGRRPGGGAVLARSIGLAHRPRHRLRALGSTPS